MATSPLIELKLIPFLLLCKSGDNQVQYEVLYNLSSYLLKHDLYLEIFSSLYQSIQGNFSIDVSSYEKVLRSLDYESDAENMKDIRQSILNT